MNPYDQETHYVCAKHLRELGAKAECCACPPKKYGCSFEGTAEDLKPSEEKKDWEKGSLSTIIGKKKDDFAFFLDGNGFSEKEIEAILPQAEKAIRESVEEALREVSNFGTPEKGCDGCEMSCGHALMDFKERVKEFMK